MPSPSLLLARETEFGELLSTFRYCFDGSPTTSIFIHGVYAIPTGRYHLLEIRSGHDDRRDGDR